MVFYPPPLPERGCIGVVAPSRRPQRAWIDGTIRRLEARGVRVKVYDQVFFEEGQLAGSDAQRAQALHEAFADPSVHAILCARGGTGATLVLDKLDFELIRRNPKPFIGFSDATVLLQAITSRTGMVTYHGPMGWNFSDENYDARTEGDLFSMIAGNKKSAVFTGLDVAREGRAQGPLVGGNMKLLQCLIGTPFDWSARDAILFIEETGEYLYALERTMSHLRLAGKFEGIRAVIVGEILDLLDDNPKYKETTEAPYGRTAKDIMLRHLPADVPLVFDFPCGHGRYNTTLPVGADVCLSLEGQEARLDFSP